MGLDLDDARDQASDAAADARAIGDPVFEAAALAGGAIARVSAGEGAAPVDEAAAALERLTPAQLSPACPRSGCSAAAAARSASSTPPSPTSIAAPRWRSRRGVRTSGFS